MSHTKESSDEVWSSMICFIDSNLPFFKSDVVESILRQCYRLPESDDEGEWYTCKEVCQSINKKYPEMKSNNSTKVKIGQTLRYLGCVSKHTKHGVAYKLISKAA